MKKVLCIICCFSAILCCTSCSTQSVQNDRSNRPIKLTYPSKPEESSVQETEDENTELIETADPMQDFVYIPKREQLPDYMLNNPKLYANMLQNILKLYYSGLISGRINNTNFIPRYSTDILPSPDTSPEERKKMAISCTVGGALEYFGYDQTDYMKYIKMYNGCLPYFCYDRDANIYTADSISPDHVLNMTGMSQSLYFIFRYINNDKLERDVMSYAAQNINNLVKNYYQDIKNGTITSKTKLRYTSDIFPESDVSSEERLKYADNATIAGAIDHAGFYTVYFPYITKLGYNKTSSIFTLPDFTDPDVIAIPSEDTKISELK